MGPDPSSSLEASERPWHPEAGTWQDMTQVSSV